MFFTRVYRPYQSVRVIGLLVLLLGGWLLYARGWDWYGGYAILAIGLVMALYVRKLIINEEERHLTTITGIWPIVSKHVHPAHQLRSIKLAVNHRNAKDPGVALRP